MGRALRRRKNAVAQSTQRRFVAGVPSGRSKRFFCAAERKIPATHADGAQVRFKRVVGNARNKRIWNRRHAGIRRNGRNARTRCMVKSMATNLATNLVRSMAAIWARSTATIWARSMATRLATSVARNCRIGVNVFHDASVQPYDEQAGAFHRRVEFHKHWHANGCVF